MPTLAERAAADNRRRQKMRRQQAKETAALIARQMAEKVKRIREIPEEEWRRAELEDEGA